jgi:hypothetical protein
MTCETCKHYHPMRLSIKGDCDNENGIPHPEYWQRCGHHTPATPVVVTTQARYKCPKCSGANVQAQFFGFMAAGYVCFDCNHKWG